MHLRRDKRSDECEKVSPSITVWVAQELEIRTPPPTPLPNCHDSSPRYSETLTLSNMSFYLLRVLLLIRFVDWNALSISIYRLFNQNLRPWWRVSITEYIGMILIFVMVILVTLSVFYFEWYSMGIYSNVFDVFNGYVMTLTWSICLKVYWRERKKPRDSKFLKGWCFGELVRVFMDNVQFFTPLK